MALLRSVFQTQTDRVSLTTLDEISENRRMIDKVFTVLTGQIGSAERQDNTWCKAEIKLGIQPVLFFGKHRDIGTIHTAPTQCGQEFTPVDVRYTNSEPGVVVVRHKVEVVPRCTWETVAPITHELIKFTIHVGVVGLYTEAFHAANTEWLVQANLETLYRSVGEINLLGNIPKDVVVTR